MMKNRKKRFTSSLLPMLLCVVFAGILFSSQAFAARTYSPDGKGYLDYITTDTGHAQPLLHLEGTGYEMGFQHGYLMGAAAAKVACDDFFIDIGRGYVEMLGPLGPVVEKLLLTEIGKRSGVNYLTSGKRPADFIIDFFKIVAKNNEKYIPREYLDEMHGIADGARAAGVDLKYEDILLVNVGFDALLSFGYPIASPLLIAADKAGDLKGLQLSCNAFVMDGKATVDRNLYLGRDFMFSGPGFTDHPVIFEIYGNGRNRVVSVGVAGIVGVIAAMNEKGLGIGMDMVPSTDCTPGDVGMGTLLTARDVMAKANELSQGVKIIKDSKRGASWLYILADGKGAERGGKSVEVSAKHVFVRGMEYVEQTWLQKLLGTAARQQEKHPDFILQTNHYMLPNMYANVPLNYIDQDSQNRYNSMIQILKDPYHPLGGYGTYDVDKAFNYINWMHLTGNEPDDHKVNQSTTLFDLTNLRMKTLCGPTFAHGATKYDWRE